MTYQPDSTLVRECATRIIQDQIEEIRDLGQMDIGEMCAEEIEALQEPLGGWNAPGADDVADALIAAVRKDIGAAQITGTWPETVPDLPAKIWFCQTVGSWSEAYATRQLAMDALANDWRDDFPDSTITWRASETSEDVEPAEAELRIFVDGEDVECQVVSGRIITAATVAAGSEV